MKAMQLVCSGRCISLVKSSLNLRFITRKFRNFSMLYSSLLGSLATTSMNTRSWLSLISYWQIYSIIGMPLDVSPSGQWNWELSALISSRAAYQITSTSRFHGRVVRKSSCSSS
jgi:hypothetical protein